MIIKKPHPVSLSAKGGLLRRGTKGQVVKEKTI